MKKLFTLLLIAFSIQAFCVKLTFQVDMTGQDVSRGVYLTGNVTVIEEGGDWFFKEMSDIGNNIYSWDTSWVPNDTIVYYFLTTNSWDNYLDYRETVPEDCDGSAELMGWDGDRAFIMSSHDTVIFYAFGTCDVPVGISKKEMNISLELNVYPNPSIGNINLDLSSFTNSVSVDVIDISGKVKRTYNDLDNSLVKLNINVNKGIYFIKVSNSKNTVYKKVIIN